jgi:[NiFe] hydrogenase assembly HybE family chaperone
MAETTGLLPDPSPHLDAAFRAIAGRMYGLAFVNPAVEVEAVGFAPWEATWLGVMVTPWFMNLMLLPRDPILWRPLSSGAKRTYAFPAGSFEFISAREAAVGEYLSCSLFSPLLEFDDHASARLVASLARAALFDPANAEVAVMPEGNLSPELASGDRRRLARMDEQLATPLSKRDFLRGSFVGGDRGNRG